jgi:hypothetical protein
MGLAVFQIERFQAKMSHYPSLHTLAGSYGPTGAPKDARGTMGGIHAALAVPTFRTVDCAMPTLPKSRRAQSQRSVLVFHSS